MLSHQSDRRTVLFIMTTVVILMSFYLLDDRSWAAIQIPFLSVLCLIACVVNHNHMHHPTFKLAWLNRTFELALTLVRGHTSATIWLPHNQNHHSQSGKTEDWISPIHVDQRQSLWAFITYTFKSMRMMRKERQIHEPRVPSYIRKKRQDQTLFLITFICIISVYNPVAALLYFFIPWFLGAFLLVGVNLYQHANCSTENQMEGSRNFTNSIENWIFFNNGYHTIHHLKPDAHWSLLPDLHKQIENKIPRHLVQGSILIYSLENMISKPKSASEQDFRSDTLQNQPS